MSHMSDQAIDTKSLPWLQSYPDDVSWDMEIPQKPLPALLDKAVAGFADHPAITFLGKTITYRELADAVDQAAAGLQKQGVQKGVKVGLLLPNTPTFIIYYFAILKTGATVVNFNPLYTVEELAYQVTDSQTEFMVTHDLTALFPKVEALIQNGTLNKAIVISFTGQLPTLKSTLFRLFKRSDIANVSASAVADRVISGRDLMQSGHKFTPVEIDAENDIAVLQYTGGTTGTPKGAMLTHGNIYANTFQVASWAEDLIAGKEAILGALPLFHVFAMTVVMCVGVSKAARLILMPRFQLDEALKLIHNEKPTMMPAVPTIFTAMLNSPKLKSHDLSSLRFCISGGAPLPLEIKLAFERETGSKVVEGYGLSEASPVLTCNPIHGLVVEGSIGPPLPQTLISLRDLDDPTKEVPHGERGELCAKGPQVMKGYWNKPAETEQVFVGSYLRTGDVAIMDENGFFAIVDRIKDLIICSGYNVYPRRIEEAIYEHPAIEEVTVIGVKDSYRGEAPKAFIKLKEGKSATTDQIMEHLKVKLSKIELPAEIEFRDALPKTMIGKLSKKELAAEEAERDKTP